MKITSTPFKAFFALFLFFQTNIQAQISDDVITDSRFWATGKIKPISMTRDDRDPKVAVNLEEAFNGSVWYSTTVDSSKLDNSCNRFFSARYFGGLTTPLRLNVTDSFIYANNRLGIIRTIVYNASINPITISTQNNANYFYVAGSTRSEPDSIVTLVIQGGMNTTNVKTATFDASNRITSIISAVRNGINSTPQTRVTYKYSSSNGLTDVSTENWVTATNRWVACTTCENFTIKYDNTARIIEQVQNRSNGDSARYLLTYIGATNKVKTFTKQQKTVGTTTWIQEFQTTNNVQNVRGYPTIIDYFDGGDSIKIAYQYLADSAMTQRLIAVKNGTGFVNLSRITQTYCTPCTTPLPVIQSQPNPTTTAYVGQVPPGIGIYGTNIAAFQWQVSTNNGANWTNIDPTDTTIYKVGSFGDLTGGGNFVELKAPTIAQNGHRFRVIVSNGCGGSVTSTVSILSVQNCALVSPTIQFQPQNTTRFVGQTASFNVTATNVGTYEWFYYKATDTINRFVVSPLDTTFTGQGTNVLTLKYAKTIYDGYYFRCYLRNGCALTTITNLVQLTVQTCAESVPTYQGQPSNTTVNSNATASFSIASNTPNVNFRWEVKLPGTTVWRTIFISDTTFMGQQTNTLTINYAKYDYHLYEFRCRAFTCAGVTVSNPALLSVICPGGLPTVVTDPSSVTTTVGTPRRIDVTGTNIASAQWQVSDGNGGVMRDILPTDTTYTIGATTATNANITIKYPKRTQNGFAYRVILTNSCGNTKASDGTALIVNFPLAVNELDAKVRIYPNPTENYINIEMPYTNFKVTLSDSKGSVMLISENKNQISIKELSTGLYFLNVKTADGETTKKIVKH
jgi:predicted secreted protein